MPIKGNRIALPSVKSIKDAPTQESLRHAERHILRVEDDLDAHDRRIEVLENALLDLPTVHSASAARSPIPILPPTLTIYPEASIEAANGVRQDFTFPHPVRVIYGCNAGNAPVSLAHMSVNSSGGVHFTFAPKNGPIELLHA